MTARPTPSVPPAVWGFAFVLVCFAESFWVALLCVLGAVVVQTGAQLVRGELSLAELQERAEGARSGFSNPSGRGV